MINRKRTQMSPRFFRLPEGGWGAWRPGNSSSGTDSGDFVFIAIQTAY
jgi:hypothetical protein